MTDLCQGTTKSGSPCKSKPIQGSIYCRQHQVIELVEKEAEPEPVKRPSVCGHQNVHYTQGDLFCDLEPGHDGPHSAVFHYVKREKGVVTIDEMQRTHWQDIAGTPVDEIEPDYDALARLLIERKIADEARKLAGTR